MATTSFTTKPLFLNNPIYPSVSNRKPQNVCMRKNAFRVSAVSIKWEPSKVVPQADRVLVRLEQLPEKSAGGVLLPKSAVKFERYLMGEILSVGSEVEEVEAGKKVLFSDINAYEELEIPRGLVESIFRIIPFIEIPFLHQVDLGTEEKHCFLKASDLLAVVQ